MNTYETLTGEFWWVKAHEPEEGPAQFNKPGQPPKFAWKIQFRPNAESVMKIIDLQSKGVKNQLKKTEDGKSYFINFSRPTEIPKKFGPSTKLTAPTVFGADGKTPIKEQVGNGSKGNIILELYEHRTPTGKAHAARWFSLTVTDLVPYGNKTPEQPQTDGWN
jgi:hypothetical protein